MTVHLESDGQCEPACPLVRRIIVAQAPSPNYGCASFSDAGAFGAFSAGTSATFRSA
jgi:hypothetical protein